MADGLHGAVWANGTNEWMDQRSTGHNQQPGQPYAVASSVHTMAQDRDKMYTNEKLTVATLLLKPAADPANDKQALVTWRPAVENENPSVGNEKPVCLT